MASNLAFNQYYERRCPICLGAYFLKTMPDGCNHMFCKPCIVDWLDIKNECPICRIKFTRVFTPAVVPNPNPSGTEEISFVRVDFMKVSSELLDYMLYGGPYRRR